MPIIGSSSIMGGGSSFTGDTGPKGPTGNTGTPGSIKGGTGSTAIYIERVISDKQNNTITFYTSDGNITTLSGFSGPSGFVNGVEGISAAINPNYFSLFNNVVNGMTLNFKGICAGNNVSITANSEKITVNLNSPSGSYSTSPKENYVVFSNNSTLDSTEIFVNNNDVLNFGLTGIPPSTATNKLYTLLKEDINFVNSISPSSNGGIVLNLKNNSNHWLQTPMGITSFAGISLSGVRQEYTLFVEGSDVWNLPKNLYFDRTEQGIQNYGFLDGINILHIWSDNGGVTYNGVFVERGIGATGPFNFVNIGSCCYKKYGYSYCRDGITKRTCQSLNGLFEPLTTCSSRTNIDSCGSRAEHNIRGETGACCCGITGCLDNSPGSIDPSVVVMSRYICENIISGKFYPQKICGSGDKWPAYGVRSIDGNTAPNIFCHKDCIQPVSCYRIINNIGFCSLETLHHCNEIGGHPFVNRTCSEIDQIGGGAELTREGWCYKFGVCSDRGDVKKIDCIECGHWNETECDKNPVIPVSKTIITTLNPLIKIVHSVGSVDDNNVVTTYSQKDTTANYLTFQISQETTQRHTLYGVVKFLDTSISGQTVFNIWDLKPQRNTCFNINIFDEDGITLTENSFIEKDRRYFLEVLGVPSKCTDTDFKAELYLGLNSCVGGFTLSSKSDTVPIIYTRSPCSCVAIDTSETFGDVINKAPITIPYTAERFCLDCTKRFVSIKGNDSFYSNIPYPLKRQSGLITFCPPTENFQDNPISVCTNPEGFCVSYGLIEELSGCTYSSLFDANNDGKIFNDTNTAFSDCYHAEYNIPGAGTTYFYTGNSNQNIRTCQTKCKIRTHYSSTLNELTAKADCSTVNCVSDSTNPCCGTFNTTKKTELNNCKTCAGNNGSMTGPCGYNFSSPYFNRITLDANALYDIGSRYNIDIGSLEKNVISVIERKNLLFDPNFIGVGVEGPRGITTYDPNVGGATIERFISFPRGGGITLNPDPDERAKASCATCSSFFDISTKIRIPKPIPGQPPKQYDVFGIVMEKENICTVEEKKANPKTFKETNIDNKYYIFIKATDNSCYLIYDIGKQTIINSPIRGVTDKFFDFNTLCSLNCEDYTVGIKEVVWFGTVNTGIVPQSTDPCVDSLILDYTINKNLNSREYLFESPEILSIEDLITFRSITHTPILEITKKQQLASTISQLSKGTISQHKNKFCSLCSGDDCFSDIVQNMIEFIGNTCTLDGISGAGANLEFYTNKFTLLPDPLNLPFDPAYKVGNISAGFYYTLTGGFAGLSGWGRDYKHMISGFGPYIYGNFSAGANCACAIRVNDSYRLECHGERAVHPPMTEIGVADVAVGYGHVAWLYNSSRGISFSGVKDSNNSYTFFDGPRSPAGLGWTYTIQYSSISSGKFHTCGILLNGKGVTCYGNNFYGQCDVPDGLTADAIACGGHHTIALLGNGGITAWGITAFNIRSGVPKTGKYTNISAGYLHNCAISDSGGITCWGYTFDGQCNSPTSGGPYIEVSAGREHSVALDNQGNVYCWGVIGDDGVCASFEDRTLVENNLKNLYWFREGNDYSSGVKFTSLFSKLPASDNGITLYYSTDYSKNNTIYLTSLYPKFHENVLDGGIYLSDGRIKKQKRVTVPPSSDISFYYLYNPATKGIPTNTQYSLYDTLYDDLNPDQPEYFRRINENQYVVLKRTMPRLNVDSTRDTVSISDIKTYIIIDTLNSSYEPLITFNLKRTNTESRLLPAIYGFTAGESNIQQVNHQYNINPDSEPLRFTRTARGGPSGNGYDDNEYYIKGKAVLDYKDAALNFTNKYLMIYSQTYLQGNDVFSNSILTYPGVSLSANAQGTLKSFIYNGIGTYNYIGNFDIKPIPEQETGQQSEFVSNIRNFQTDIQNKYVEGNCISVDCYNIPEFCRNYSGC